jgi:hypothetical protein
MTEAATTPNVKESGSSNALLRRRFATACHDGLFLSQPDGTLHGLAARLHDLLALAFRVDGKVQEVFKAVDAATGRRLTQGVPGLDATKFAVFKVSSWPATFESISERRSCFTLFMVLFLFD